MQLVQSKLILRQLDSFVCLILRLFRNHCQRESLLIANQLSFLLSKFESPLKDSQIANFLDMIIYLEKHPTMADLQRNTHVVIFFGVIATRDSDFPITKKIFHEMLNDEIASVKEITRSKHGSGTSNSLMVDRQYSHLLIK